MMMHDSNTVWSFAWFPSVYSTDPFTIVHLAMHISTCTQVNWSGMQPSEACTRLVLCLPLPAFACCILLQLLQMLALICNCGVSHDCTPTTGTGVDDTLWQGNNYMVFMWNLSAHDHDSHFAISQSDSGCRMHEWNIKLHCGWCCAILSQWWFEITSISS